MIVTWQEKNLIQILKVLKVLVLLLTPSFLEYLNMKNTALGIHKNPDCNSTTKL
jgi:hypothetical protein